MPPNPTPKPFRGWAVYDSNGAYVPGSFSDSETEHSSWLAAGFELRDYKTNLRPSYLVLLSRGYTCRRVIVSAEEGK